MCVWKCGAQTEEEGKDHCTYEEEGRTTPHEPVFIAKLGREELALQRAHQASRILVALLDGEGKRH